MPDPEDLEPRPNWRTAVDRVVGPFSTILGVVVVLVGAVVPDGLGVNRTSLALVGGIAGVTWVVWVTRRLLRLETAGIASSSSVRRLADGLAVAQVRVVHESTARESMPLDWRINASSDATKAGVQAKALGQHAGGRNLLILQRLLPNYRIVCSLRRYSTLDHADTDESIPGSRQVKDRGAFGRALGVEFEARVKGAPQDLRVMLRTGEGDWLLAEDRKSYFTKQVSITEHQYTSRSALFGPLPSDKPCYVSLDFLPGATGAANAVEICNVRVVEYAVVR